MAGAKFGSALWFQVGEALKDDIKNGKLRPGSKLPTEPELAGQFKVSRNTIRRAMSELEEQGLVRIEQGRGSFVHDRFVDFHISKRTRFTQNLKRQGLSPSHELMTSQVEMANEKVASVLNIAINDPVVVLISRMSAENVFVSLNKAFYPQARFPDIDKKREQSASMTSVLAEYGIEDYQRLSTSITARPPTDDEARALQQPRSRWVICTEKVDVDKDGVPICCSTGIWAADLVRFTVDD